MKIYEVRIKTLMRQVWELMIPITLLAESPKDAAKIVFYTTPVFALEYRVNELDHAQGYYYMPSDLATSQEEGNK